MPGMVPDLNLNELHQASHLGLSMHTVAACDPALQKIKD